VSRKVGKNKSAEQQSTALLFLYLFPLCGLCGSLSFCPPLFHHFRNTSFSRGAKTTTATPPAPAIAWPGPAAAPAVSTFQSKNGLL